MGKRGWQHWGARFRDQIKGKKTLAEIAEKMGQAESTLYSWTNGTRPIRLDDFFRLCETAEVDAVRLLFAPDQHDVRLLILEAAWHKADERGKELISIAAEAAAQRHHAADKRGHS